MSRCLENAIDKEIQLPKLVYSIIKKLKGEQIEEDAVIKKALRSKEEILKDYGLEVK